MRGGACAHPRSRTEGLLGCAQPTAWSWDLCFLHIVFTTTTSVYSQPRSQMGRGRRPTFHLRQTERSLLQMEERVAAGARGCFQPYICLTGNMGSKDVSFGGQVPAFHPAGLLTQVISFFKGQSRRQPSPQGCTPLSPQDGHQEALEGSAPELVLQRPRSWGPAPTSPLQP